MSAYVESILEGGTAYQSNTWMRRCRIIFTAKEPLAEDSQAMKAAESYFSNPGKKSGLRVVLGDNEGDNFNIKINGTKNLALTKDNGTIEISNVAYDTIALIQALKLYRIEIWVGYANNRSLMRFAKGEVTYMTQKIQARQTSTLYITYASELVATWSQHRINFNIRSGTNVYAMLNYLFMKEGTEKVNITPELKNLVSENIINEYGTTSNIVEASVSNSSSGVFLSADSSLDDKVINVTTLAEKRVIPIDLNMVNIGGGHPTVTSQGLNIILFPVIHLMPGDILKIDNSFLDITQGMTNAESVKSAFNTNYIDPNGCYMIRMINYAFENRGNNFYLQCQCVALSVYSGVTGIAEG